MTLLRDFLRLIRSLNLIYIVLTMYFVRLYILQPADEAGLSDLDFALLVLSTVLVAAAGYIINDYFDVKIDVVNRKGEIIVDKTITRRKAMATHQLFNVVAVILGFYVAWKANALWLGFIPLVSVTLLWFYSTTFKRHIIIGNVVVSLLSAMVVIVAVLYESPKLELSRLSFILMACYSGFAFLVSMIREVIKDMQDVEGDRKDNCKTLPIVYGVRNSKLVTVIMNLLVMIFIVIVQAKGTFLLSEHAYIVTLILLPLALNIYLVAKADTPVKFHRASNLVKFIMLTGIFSLPVFEYLK